MIRRYGVLGANGYARRVTFVIDGKRRIVGLDRKVDDSFARKDGEVQTTHLSDMSQIVSD